MKIMTIDYYYAAHIAYEENKLLQNLRKLK